MGRNGQRYLWRTPLVTVCASPSESPYRYCGDLAGQETLRTCSRTFGDRSTPRDWAKLSDVVLLSKTTAKSDSLGYNFIFASRFPCMVPRQRFTNIYIERPYCSLHTKFISPQLISACHSSQEQDFEKALFLSSWISFPILERLEYRSPTIIPNGIPSI